MYIVVLYTLALLACTDDGRCTPSIVVTGFASKRDRLNAAGAVGRALKAADPALTKAQALCTPTQTRDA